MKKARVQKLTLSFSSLSLWQRCRRRFANQYIKGYASQDETPALAFGSVLHEGLAILHAPLSFNQPLLPPSSIFQEIEFLATSEGIPDSTQKNPILAAISKMQQVATGKLPRERLLNPYDFERYSIDHAFRLIAEYYNLYQPETFQGVGTEQSFNVKVSDRVYFRGTVDGVGKFEGYPCLLEHKTAGDLWRFKDNMQISDQVVGYALAARIFGLKVDKVLCNGILTQWGKNNRKLRSDPASCFLRTLVHVPEYRVNEFEGMLARVGNEIIDHIENDKPFDKSAHEACYKFNTACPYVTACLSGPQEQTVLESICEPKKWEGLEVVYG